MATNPTSGDRSVERNIPAALIDEARQHVYEAAIRTPLVRLNYDGPCDIYLKLECLQPIGSFKIRGAWNAVRLLPEEQRRRGVWTVSAGNAAQGVALAARRAGVPCKILMIDAAPQAKFDAVRRLGGEVVKASYDQCWKALADRSHIAMNGAFIHPFEDDAFIAGNASAGLEIIEDLPDVDCVVAGFGVAACRAALLPLSELAGTRPESSRLSRRRRLRSRSRSPRARPKISPTGKPVLLTGAEVSPSFPACGSSRIICSPAPLFPHSRRHATPCAL
jgi:Pyridoxal-phosphate dependent enzyme